MESISLTTVSPEVKVALLKELGYGSDGEYVVLDPDFDVVFGNSGHFENDDQSVLRLIDIGSWYEYPKGNGCFFLLFEFSLLLDLEFLL